MQISIENIGRRYNREWIFRGINLEIAAGTRMAVTGGNGSGKSTFLKVVSGFLSPSEGTRSYKNDGSLVSDDHIYKHISYTGPYTDLYGSFSVAEMLKFHLKFKTMREQLGATEILDLVRLSAHQDKSIGDLSSGMRQRLKLGLAILSDTSILLLDEPTENLDADGIAWYQSLVEQHLGNRIILVASNRQSVEYNFADRELSIVDFKG